MTDPPEPALLDGRYELIELISEGGSARVYRAWDRQTDEWRALKVLMPEFTKRSTLRDRFHRQWRTMKSLLDHPNVIRAYDAGSDVDQAWIALEYAEGGSIVQWIERFGPMPPRMAAEVAIQVCRGVAYLHQHAVLHRNLALHNVVVDRHGTCKLVGFGIAQIITETRITMTGTVMGGFGYIAPEQHESAKHADQRADVYGLAATVYTLAHGEAANHLFMAEDRDYEGIPEPLARVIHKGAQYRREARYQSVEEMLAALEEILEQLPPDPQDTPPLVALVEPPGDAGPRPVDAGLPISFPWVSHTSELGPRDTSTPPPVTAHDRLLSFAVLALLLAAALWCGLPWLGS